MLFKKKHETSARGGIGYHVNRGVENAKRKYSDYRDKQAREAQEERDMRDRVRKYERDQYKKEREKKLRADARKRAKEKAQGGSGISGLMNALAGDTGSKKSSRSRSNPVDALVGPSFGSSSKKRSNRDPFDFDMI